MATDVPENPEDGGDAFLQNAGSHRQDQTSRNLPLPYTSMPVSWHRELS
jgi:hypothetical protein